ncbi:acetyltransferase, partial [Vibrio vulnificus]
MPSIKERDYFFDNARAILIFLVVLGHLLQPY